MTVSAKSTATPREKALLVGVRLKRRPRWEVEEHLEELGRLAETAGAEVAFSTLQELDRPYPGTFIGSGKVEEIALLCESLEIDLVIFDDPLTPAQQKKLEEAIKRKILDRSALILDIFAKRALTTEGRLQVELAQYQYLLPRLTRMWTHLSRLGGGIGTRGPGETQLEVDRRRIGTRIEKIKDELRKVEKHRNLLRSGRRKAALPLVALVGYTNAGKSTLLNALSKTKEVLADDKLFATLDPSVRRVRLPSGKPMLLTDTVGFIRKLPHQLVAAFKSTLEQLHDADLILHIIDAATPQMDSQMAVVAEVLDELGLSEKPQFQVYNKFDAILAEGLRERLGTEDGAFAISALRGMGLGELLEALDGYFSGAPVRVRLKIPVSESKLVALFYEKGRVEHRDDRGEDVLIEGRIPRQMLLSFKPFTVTHEEFLRLTGREEQVR